MRWRGSTGRSCCPGVGLIVRRLHCMWLSNSGYVVVVPVVRAFARRPLPDVAGADPLVTTRPGHIKTDRCCAQAIVGIRREPDRTRAELFPALVLPGDYSFDLRVLNTHRVLGTTAVHLNADHRAVAVFLAGTLYSERAGTCAPTGERLRGFGCWGLDRHGARGPLPSATGKPKCHAGEKTNDHGRAHAHSRESTVGSLPPDLLHIFLQPSPQRRPAHAQYARYLPHSPPKLVRFTQYLILRLPPTDSSPDRSSRLTKSGLEEMLRDSPFGEQIDT